MPLDDYAPVWETDHCYPMSRTNLSKETDMNKSKYWIKLRPIYSSKIRSMGYIIDYGL